MKSAKSFLAVFGLVVLGHVAHAAPAVVPQASPTPSPKALKATSAKPSDSSSSSGYVPESQNRLEYRRAAAEKTGAFKLKPLLGVNAMRVRTDGENSNMGTGITTGVLLERGAGFASFETGLEFNQYGGKYSSGRTDMKIDLYYLSVPLAAKLNFINGPNKAVYLKGGVIPSFMIAKQSTVTSDGVTKTTSDFEVNSFDTLAQLAIGGAIPVSRSNSIGIELSYLRGLINLSKSSGWAYNEGVMLNTNFAFSLL